MRDGEKISKQMTLKGDSVDSMYIKVMKRDPG